VQKLKGIYRLAWYRNETAQVRLLSILRALHRAGIPTMVLKGAALIASYYPRPGLRPMSDIDVAVHGRDVAAAVSCLESLGGRGTKTPSECRSRTSCRRVTR
jgi:Uncharacterised nucleotidyltransferase